METNAPVLFMLVVNIIVERDFLNNFNNCPMFNILSIPYLFTFMELNAMRLHLYRLLSLSIF